jgi:hypothetical protein
MGAITEISRNPLSGVVNERRMEASLQMFDIERGNAKPSFYYLNTVLAQTSLPHKDPGDMPFFKCENGNVATTLVRGTLRNPFSGKIELQGYPYGTKPRLMLMYLCSRATLTGSKEIYLGGSLTEFQRRIGIEQSTGGVTGSLAPTKNQLMRLVSTHLQLYCGAINAYSMTHAVPPIKRFDFWLPEGRGAMKWEGMVTLDDEIFNCLQDRSCPLQASAIVALHNSSLALDIYTWLAFRLWRIKVSPMRPLPWDSLHAQFGSGYSRIRDFRKAFKESLQLVKSVYPEACFSFDHNDELVLRRSQPPVAKSTIEREVKTLQLSLNY